jgi:cyclophilin family peptidyl-prolyl cis-trans isomerase
MSTRYGAAFALGAMLLTGLFWLAQQPSKALTERTNLAYTNAKKEKMAPDPIVTIETSKGTIKIQVFKNDAPITAGNFLDLVGRGFYNGLTFHRYEPGFVIQGGDPKGDGTGSFVDPQTNSVRHIPLEKKPNLKHDQAGTVAMARANDPGSASCQFYITLAPASFLDNPPGYAVFGKVIDGMPNVMQLRAGDKITSVTAQEAAVR